MSAALPAIDLQLHHIGLATSEFDAALRWYGDLGYVCSAEACDPQQGVELRLLENSLGAPRVELIKPLTDRSPVSRYLRRIGSCIYHTCYEVQSLEESLERIRERQRVIPISEPVPAILFHGRRVSFWQVAGVGLLELLETCS